MVGLSRWQLAQRVMIVFAMQACNGNKSHAAKWLGISVRAIRYKIKRYEIRRDEYAERRNNTSLVANNDV